jgi:hypothetical protein
VVHTELHRDAKNRRQQNSHVIPTNGPHLEPPFEPPETDAQHNTHLNGHSDAASLPFFKQLETLGAEALAQLLDTLSSTPCIDDLPASVEDVQNSKTQYQLALDATLKKLGIEPTDDDSTTGKRQRKKRVVTHSVTVSPNSSETEHRLTCRRIF